MNGPVFSADKLSYRYQKTPVIQTLSFAVEPGEFFIIIGPNGSGKTTLMKLLSGQIAPQQGHLSLLGKRLSRYSRRELARLLALVPQSVSTDFPFTVTETVLLGRAPHLGTLGLEGESDRKLACQAMEFTGVARFADRKLDQLSGGERQRVFIARAICQEPSIILLDEPTAALDLAHQVRVMDLMERLKAEKGLTVVMVSHDLNLAALYGDRLLLLKHGASVRLGPPDAVLSYDILEKTYECNLLVDQSPLAGAPRVTLVPGRFSRK